MFRFHFSVMDNLSRKKTNEQIEVLNNITHKLDLTDIFNTPSNKRIHIKCTWNLIQDRFYGRLDISLNKFKNIEILNYFGPLWNDTRNHSKYQKKTWKTHKCGN